MDTISTKIEKILNYKTWNKKRKSDALLEMDATLRTNLGTDSTKKELSEAKSKSRKIYRAIRDHCDIFWGTYYLRTMDL